MISYNKIKVDGIKLSPSQFTEFFRNPKEWLNGMENRSTFNGNVSTVLGTCIHYIFESDFSKRPEKQYWQDVDVYLDEEHNNVGCISEGEVIFIRNELKAYYPAVMDWIKNVDSAETILSETELVYCVSDLATGNYKPANDYYIAGSADAIVRRDGKLILRDYKSSKSKKSSLGTYLDQLLTYAYAYNKTHEGEEQIEAVEVINIYKLKTKGVQFNVITEKVFDSDFTKLEKDYNLIIKTHDTYVKHPKLRNLLFREGVNFMGQRERGLVPNLINK